MKPRTWTHPKFCLLQRRLGICPALAAGILEGIWHLAATFDPGGGKLPYTDDELAAWLGVDLAPDELLAALVDGRWIDDDEDGLRVHDWEEHRPSYIQHRVKEQARYRTRTSTPVLRRPAQDCTEPAQTCLPSASASASAYTSKVHVLDSSKRGRARVDPDVDPDMDHKREGKPEKAKTRRKSAKANGHAIRTAVTVDAIAEQARGIFTACKYSGDDGGNLWGVAALMETGIGDLSEAEVFSACRGASLNGNDKPAHFYACLAESVAKRHLDLKQLLRQVNILPAWPKTKGGD